MVLGKAEFKHVDTSMPFFSLKTFCWKVSTFAIPPPPLLLKMHSFCEWGVKTHLIKIKTLTTAEPNPQTEEK